MKKIKMLALLTIFFASTNPFLIDFKEKEPLTSADYREIQAQLREISLAPLLRDLYPVGQGYAEFEDFLNRISVGCRQVLINVEKNLLPLTQFEKINEGGDHCIVTCVPQSEPYISLVATIPQALRECGFNGYLLAHIGGFPNPTGKEILSVGVPYSFKVFMVLEACKWGFNKVLWMDSALLPLKNPLPLFQEVEKKGAFLLAFPAAAQWRYILPATRQLLLDLEGVDVLHSLYVSTLIFGLDLSRKEVWKFIREYERLVKLGTPFLSCFPEEFVFTAILGSPEYAEWSRWTPHPIVKGADHPSSLDTFFYQRPHSRVYE